MEKCSEEKLELIAATRLGEGIAHEFVSFIRLSSQFDIDRLLNEEDYELDMQDISVIYSLTGAIPNYVKNDKSDLYSKAL